VAEKMGARLGRGEILQRWLPARVQPPSPLIPVKRPALRPLLPLIQTISFPAQDV
jgi:hypothetical protein